VAGFEKGEAQPICAKGKQGNSMRNSHEEGGRTRRRLPGVVDRLNIEKKKKGGGRKEERLIRGSQTYGNSTVVITSKRKKGRK